MAQNAELGQGFSYLSEIRVRGLLNLILENSDQITKIGKTVIQ